MLDKTNVNTNMDTNIKHLILKDPLYNQYQAYRYISVIMYDHLTVPEVPSSEREK